MKAIEFLRQFKLTYMVYNLFRRKDLKHNLKLFRKYNINKSYFSPLSSADFQTSTPDDPWLDQQNSRVVLPDNPAFQALEENAKTGILDWSDKGYAIISKFFSNEQVDKINGEIDALISKEQANWRYRNKIMFAIHESEYLKQIGNDPKLKAILKLILGREVKLFQSINFLTGSEQRTHSDTIHMTTFPLGYLIAVWVALEDITLDKGPLHYYPGSHKLPYVLNKDFGNEGDKWQLGKQTYDAYEEKVAKVVQNNTFSKEIFLARKGDILIWHANLLHGGEPQLNKELTRKSMVFHYYAEDVICYHEISQRPALMKKND